MDRNQLFELDAAIDEQLRCFMDDEEDDGRLKKAVVAGGVGAGAAGGYAALRRNPKTRRAILSGEVKAENAVRGVMGKTQDATRKGLRTVRDLPGKAGDTVKDAARMKVTQAGNLAHRASEKVGMGYKGRQRVKNVVKNTADMAGGKLKGIKDVLKKAVKMRRFESREEFDAYARKCVELAGRFDDLLEFRTPMLEKMGRDDDLRRQAVDSQKRYEKESYVGRGQLVGAGATAAGLYGAGKLAKNRKVRKVAGKNAGKVLSRVARVGGTGAAGAVLGGLVAGGLVGGNMRRKQKDQ